MRIRVTQAQFSEICHAKARLDINPTPESILALETLLTKCALANGNDGYDPAQHRSGGVVDLQIIV